MLNATDRRADAAAAEPGKQRITDGEHIWTTLRRRLKTMVAAHERGDPWTIEERERDIRIAAGATAMFRAGRLHANVEQLEAEGKRLIEATAEDERAQARERSASWRRQRRREKMLQNRDQAMTPENDDAGRQTPQRVHST